jgi:hypothetical protein
MICVYCLSHVPALLTLDIAGYAGRNMLLIVFLILTVQSSDVFQYVWGKLIGKRKVSPAISPSKTVEGLVGGVLTSTAVGAALWWITPFTPLEAGLIALVINVMGFFGGFVLSAIKRDRGVKDWGAHDRRPWRHARPGRFDQLLGTHLLPHRALLVGVSRWQQAAANLARGLPLEGKTPTLGSKQ